MEELLGKTRVRRVMKGGIRTFAANANSDRQSTEADLSRSIMSAATEYVSGKLIEWASEHHITLSHIQPGKPQQNAYIERYNRTVRNEWLGTHIFHSIQEVQDHATQWLWTYNNDRPNMGIGGITPAMKLNQHKMAA
jgi:transposase InsO family protein